MLEYDVDSWVKAIPNEKCRHKLLACILAVKLIGGIRMNMIKNDEINILLFLSFNSNVYKEKMNQFQIQSYLKFKRTSPNSNEKSSCTSLIMKPSAKKKKQRCERSRQKIAKNQKMSPYQKQRFLQSQLDDMFAQMNNILNSTNRIIEQSVFSKILREHLYEAKRNMVDLILSPKKIIDEKNQQLNKREELNYYQMRLRYFMRFKSWVSQLDRMRKSEIENWHKQADSAQFPQLFFFILDEYGLQRFLNTSLAIQQATRLYIKYVNIFKDQQKELIQIHFLKIQIFLSHFKILSKMQPCPENNMVLFLKVNYGGIQNIKELLSQPKIYEFCQQYIKWDIYLSSR